MSVDMNVIINKCDPRILVSAFDLSAFEASLLGQAVAAAQSYSKKAVEEGKHCAQVGVKMTHEFSIIGRFFVRHYLDVVKKLSQSRALELAFLVQQITFCGHNQSIILTQMR